MNLGYFLVIKANEMHCFSNLFDKVLYMFRTDHQKSQRFTQSNRVLCQINLRNSASRPLL